MTELLEEEADTLTRMPSQLEQVMISSRKQKTTVDFFQGAS